MDKHVEKYINDNKEKSEDDNIKVDDDIQKNIFSDFINNEILLRVDSLKDEKKKIERRLSKIEEDIKNTDIKNLELNIQLIDKKDI